MTTQDSLRGYDRVIGTLLDVRRETPCPFPLATGILGFLSIFKRSQASSPLNHELRVPLEVSKFCEASCRDEAET